MTVTPATEDLRAEHVGVGRMLRVIDRMSQRVEGGGSLDAGDLEHVVEFLRVFVDTCHHGKEEALLFPAVSAADPDSAREVIAGLLDDHVRGREFVSRISAAGGAHGLGDRSVDVELVEAMRGYTALLHGHIRREEDGCFAVADRILPANVQEQLEEGYERIEREVVGGGVHEAFHSLLGRLEAAYTSD